MTGAKVTPEKSQADGAHMAYFRKCAQALAILFVCSAAGVSGAAAQAAGDQDWFRDAAISPDGTSILFTSGGDIWRVPAAGGTAVPVVTDPAWDGHPIWSHDGKWIAFASDRHGDLDVYVLPAAGGTAKRLTFHQSSDTPFDFSPDGTKVLFGSTRVDAVSSSLFPSRALPELYEVSVEGDRPRMLLTTPASEARWSPDGTKIAYRDEKAYEDPLRKHDVSAFARDIWVYDVKAGTHTKLTDFAGGDHTPVWSADGSEIYYLSEQEGSVFNVWRMNADGSGKMALTHSKPFPARSLGLGNGTLAYTVHGELYTVKPGEAAKKLSVTIPARPLPNPEPLSLAGETSEFATSPDGKEVAYVARGEVFVTSVEFGTTVRITNTPEQERSIAFSPDGRALMYAAERGGKWKIYETKLADEAEKRFSVGTKFVEKLVYEADDDVFQPVYAPKGDRIAFLEHRDIIKTLDRKTGKTATVFPANLNYSYSDGDISFHFSPDGQWIVADYAPRDAMFIGNIGVAPADGSAPPRDLSLSGYSDGGPVWHTSGDIIYWSSDRYGLRSHGGWGGQRDIVAAFLTQAAWDKFNLTKEDLALIEEAKSKDDDKEKKDAPKPLITIPEIKLPEIPFLSPKKDEEAKVAIEWDGIDRRTTRLTIQSSDLAGAALSPDADKLYYLAAFQNGYDLWVHDFREDETKLLAKLDADEAGPVHVIDKDTAIVLADGSLKKISLSDGGVTPIKASPEMIVRGADERAYLFDHVWRQVKDKFYDPNMHGLDWDAVGAAYREKLPAISNDRDFAVLLSEMLGELNASHTGARYRTGERTDDRTGALGAIFDQTRTGPGLLISEILEGGPLDRADLGIEAGMSVTAIDGVELTASQNPYALLNRKAGDRVRLTITPQGGKAFDAVVRPIGLRDQNELLYQRWVDQRRALVDKLSDGKVGYVHVRSMNDHGFRQAYGEIFGRDFQKQAEIVDTRWNGGGWLHDDLVVLLSGKRYYDFRPRGRVVRGEPLARWSKPSAVVVSEGNYSDAFMFPYAYQKLKLGPIIGMPVPGTGTAVWWETLHTGDIVFGIPQLPALDDGKPVEGRELEPDYKVENDPASVAKGEDKQLAKAVEVMLEAAGQDNIQE